MNKFFPLNENVTKLKYDMEGLWSITLPLDADIISNIIFNNINDNNKIIIDAMASIGGNTISFSKFFKNIISIEINEKRYNILKNNLECYNINNVLTINDNCINKFDIDYDIIFFDPPWGGPGYKTKKKINIKIDNYSLYDIIKLIHNKKKNISIYFKLPYNYDVNEFDEFNYKINNVNNYLLIYIKN